MQKKICKFDIADMLPIGLTFVVLGISLAYGLNVMSDVKSDMVTNTAACNSTDVSGCPTEYNATVDAISGVAKIPAKMPLIATVVVAAIIIGILIRYMVVKYMQ